MLITPVNNKTKQMKYLHFRLLVTIICCFMLVNGISFSTATLSQARSSLAATSVGNYVYWVVIIMEVNQMLLIHLAFLLRQQVLLLPLRATHL